MKAKVAPQLPSGFKPISSALASSWDFEETPMIQGKIVAFNSVDSKYKDPETKKYKKQRNCVIACTDGVSRTVWESAALSGLFDPKKAKVGATVAIVFQGKKKIKGRAKPMKLFAVGVR